MMTDDEERRKQPNAFSDQPRTARWKTLEPIPTPTKDEGVSADDLRKSRDYRRSESLTPTTTESIGWRRKVAREPAEAAPSHPRHETGEYEVVETLEPLGDDVEEFEPIQSEPPPPDPAALREVARRDAARREAARREAARRATIGRRIAAAGSRAAAFKEAYDRAVDALLGRELSTAYAEFRIAEALNPDDARVGANLERLMGLGYGEEGPEVPEVGSS